MNRLGQTRETMDGWHGEHYAARAEAFGWNAIQIDGHDPEEIDHAYAEALEESGKPTLIVAKTKKGRGVSFLEDKDGLHGKPVGEDQEQAPDELGSSDDLLVDGASLTPSRGELHRRPARATDRRSGTRRRRAGHTARPSRRSAVPGRTSSRSTARSATPRTPRSSPRSSRIATSRCSSPSSRWSRPLLG